MIIIRTKLLKIKIIFIINKNQMINKIINAIELEFIALEIIKKFKNSKTIIFYLKLKKFVRKIKFHKI